MKINLVDVNEKIKQDKIKEVTNSIFFYSGTIPAEGGLFDPEIFGNIGTKDRQNRFAFIDLKGRFLQPIMYTMLTSMDRRIIEIIRGNLYVKLDSKGLIVEDSENGETGLDFLYENFENIKFRDTDSETRKTKLSIIKNLSKDEIFTTKFLVIPAALRDYNPTAKQAGKVADVDPVNTLYSNIIRSAQSLNESITFDFISNSTKASIQTNLNEIFDSLIGLIKDKNGIIRRGLMGKAVDYATRSVITSPKITSNSYEDVQVRFGYAGIPLSQLVVLFYPFFVKYISDFIDLHRTEFTNLKIGNTVIEIKDIEDQFSDTAINKMVGEFIKNIDGRFEPIRVKDENGKSYPVKVFFKDLGRYFTKTDLMYIAAVDICADKHVFISRYPIENFMNVFPAKIKVLSTKLVSEIQLDDRFLKEYPVIYPEYPSEETLWRESLVYNNAYTNATGADYDGKFC